MRRAESKGMRRRSAQIAVDICLATVFVLIEATALADEIPHEWLGVVAFALTVAHVALSRKRVVALAKGRKAVGNVLQMSIVVLLAVAIAGQIASSIVLSEYAFSWLPVIPGVYWARTTHLLFGYWSFVLVSIHAGLHMRRMPSIAGKNASQGWVVRIVLAGIVLAGAFFFFSMEIPSYLFLQTQFAFVDFSVPLWMRCFQWLCIGAAFCTVTSFIVSIGQKR